MADGGFASSKYRKSLRAAGTALGTVVTQTYSTTVATVPNATYAAPTQTANAVTFGTNVAAKTAALLLTDAVNTNAGTVATSLDQAQKDLGTAINTINTNLTSTNAKLAALAVDVLELKKLINLLIDADQSFGLLA